MRSLNRAGLTCTRGSKIAIIGIAYKKDVDDPRESPAFEIIEELLHLGADLTYHDPHIPNCRRCARTFCRLTEPEL